MYVSIFTFVFLQGPRVVSIFSTVTTTTLFQQKKQGMMVTFEKDKEDWVEVGKDLALGMDTQGPWSQLNRTPEPSGTSTISSLERGLGE